MVYVIKLAFYLLRELIFDNKDEYDFKSAKFNARKFIVLILVTLSFVINGWLLYRFVHIANDLLECREMARQASLPELKEGLCVNQSKAKKPPADSSDSGALL